MSRLSYKSLVLILLFLLIPIVLFLRINQKGKEVSAEWWDDTWMYRQAINISSHSTNESNVYITATISIGSTAKAQTDAGDFRFLNSNGQLLPYYVVSGAGTTSITFHINLDSFPAGAQTLYAYYGNPSAQNGFSASDFTTQASNYTLGSQGSEEIGGGPIAYWKFDEGVGTTAYDSSSNKLNGTFGTGDTSPSWTTEDQCVIGKCLKFDGNDYISVNNDPKLKFIDQNLTISLWVKLNANQNHKFVAKGQGTSRKGYQIGASNTQFMFTYSDTYDGSDHHVYGFNYQTNKWYFLTLVKDRNNNQIRGYVNGNQVATLDISSIVEDITDNYNLEIGRNGAYFANGLIDEVKIFPYARSDAQIKADYAAGLAGMGTNSDSTVNIGGASAKFLSDGLVGWWKFDEGIGTSAIDFSGNNFTAIMAGTLPTWSTGKYGVGLTYTDESYLNISTSSTFDFPSSDFALSTWIKMTSSDSLKTLFYKGNPYCDSCQGGYVLNVSSGTPRMTLDFNSTTGNAFTATSPTAVNDDKWHHLLGQRNGNKIEIYIDGNLSVATTFPAGSTFTDITGSPLSLSRNGWSFNGSIDEARIYNRALSPTEVRQLYEFAPGPVGYWKFEEGVGTTAFDSSGNNNHGVWQGTLGSQWTVGKIGTAGNFNGSDNRVIVNSTDKLKMDYQLTASAWVYLKEHKEYTAIIQKGNSEAGSNYMIQTRSGGIRITFGNGSTYQSSAVKTLSLNKWYYITLVADETIAKLYVDGVYTGLSVGTYGLITNDDPLRIGMMSSSSYFANAIIDEVKIYNYARTQKQILEDMAGSPPPGSTTKVSTPLVWYKFDEGFGTTANNSGHGGTTLKGNLTGSTLPTWTPNSKYKQGLSFTGSNSAVGITGITQLNNTGFTTSGWIKINSEPSYYGNMLVSSGSGFVIYYTQNTRLPYAQIYNGSSWTPISCPAKYSTSLNQWTHLALVYRSDTQTAAIYTNGAKCSTDVTISGGINSNYSTSLYIGNYSNYQPNTTIDEVKIYNYALSADEVKQDYNQGSTFVFGSSNQTIGATTTSLDYCVPGDTSPCAPPVAEWKFEEGVSTTVYDTSGNNNHGIFGTGSSAPTWTTGKIGKALNFSTNKYIDAGTSPAFNISGPVTIETWVKPNTGTGQQGIIGNSVFSQPFGLYLRHSAGSDVGFWVNPDGNRNYMTAGTINYGSWNHIAGIWDGTNLTLYINGQFSSNSKTTSAYSRNFSNLLIGNVPGIASPVFFDGLIDQVRIYNYARTPAQIAWSYNQGAPVGHWKLDECQGTTIHDSSGNSNHGTLSIGASGTQTSPGTCQTSGAWANGKLGKLNASLNLDASDDIVTIPNHTNYQFSTNDFTISTWIKPFEDINNYDTVFSKASCLNHYCYVNSLFSAYGELRWYFNDSSQTLWNNYLTFGANANFTNKWSHISATRQGTVLKGYLNGILVNTSSVPDNYNLSNSYSIEIGKEGSIGTYFPGQIDDVRIYNYALTATQVKNLYNNGAVNFR